MQLLRWAFVMGLLGVGVVTLASWQKAQESAAPRELGNTFLEEYVQPPPALAPVPAEPLSIERVQRFYAAESRRIGRKDGDPATTQKRLHTFAQSLTAAEAEWLRGQALDPQGLPDGRLFAATVLALGPSLQEARTLALSPLPTLPAGGPASGLDLERRVRMTVLDGLARRCDQLAARDVLLDVVERQVDEDLRDHAHRSGRAWQACQAKAGEKPAALPRAKP